MKFIVRATTALLVLLALAPLFFAPVPEVQAQAFGTNWIGQYYNNTTLTDPVVNTASYPNGLNFNFGTGAPVDGFGVTVPGVNADQFSARYTTTETLDAGLYEFILTADDGARLFIDGVLVLDNFNSLGLSTDSTIISLGGGTYTIIVEYFDASGPAVIQLSWVLSTGTPAPTATPAPLAIGMVERVRGLAIRTGPYLGASLINVARPEKEYPLLARNFSEGLFTWYLIRVDEDTQGWSSGRYLAVEGDPNALPVIGTVFDQIDNPPDLGVIGTTRSVMNLRVRPSPRTQRLDQIPWGDQVSIVGRTVQGGRDFWYQVRWEGKIGWILAAYVGVRGNPIDAVPIY